MPTKHWRGQRWTKMARIHLMQHPQCARCGMPGQEIHHVIPVQSAPALMYVPSNLQTLCRACHHAHHANDADKRR